jgi:DNA invertase Pin-like site-specific DNA recombinase
MTEVVTVVRQSQGTDDSVSLELQREKTDELAGDLGDENPTRVDLGVHTGFSIFMHGKDSEKRIDTDEEMLTLLDELTEGVYGHLVTWDDTRLSRDQFYWVLRWHAMQGETEFHFVENQPDDDLTFRVQRAVESEVKMKEIRKTKDAMRHRENEGFDQGRPPIGFQFDDVGEQWVPDRDGRFEDVIKAIEMVEDGTTYREVQEELDIAPSTMSGVMGRKELYLNATSEN